MSFTHPATGEKLSLTVRTSLYSEFRNPAGRLCAFEIGPEHVSFGTLCATLSRHAGVEFKKLAVASWYPRPARFSYKGFEFHVAIPFSNHWVGAIEPGDSYAALEELLIYVKVTLLHPRLTLHRSQYI